jgi:hypothetical protein
MHVEAVVKNPVSRESIDPDLVGNSRRTLTPEVAGRYARVEIRLRRMPIFRCRKAIIFLPQFFAILPLSLPAPARLPRLNAN